MEPQQEYVLRTVEERGVRLIRLSTVQLPALPASQLSTPSGVLVRLAIRPGELNFRAKTYGERYCSDYWNWSYLWSSPIPINVRGRTTQSYLPLLSAE